LYFLQSNQKKFLTNLNALFLTLFVLVLILFKSTSGTIIPSVFYGWDILLPVAIYLGQRRSLWEGLLILLFNGHLYSLNSSAPIGLFVVYYLLFFFFAQVVAYILYAQTPVSVICLLFLVTVLSRFVLPLSAQVFDQSISVFSWANWNFWNVLLNTGLGFLIYLALGLLDRVTLKVPPRNITLGDSSL
jgi:hypothetical protein